MKLELPYKTSVVQKVEEVKQETLSIEKYGMLVVMMKMMMMMLLMKMVMMLK